MIYNLFKPLHSLLLGTGSFIGRCRSKVFHWHDMTQFDIRAGDAHRNYDERRYKILTGVDAEDHWILRRRTNRGRFFDGLSDVWGEICRHVAPPGTVPVLLTSWPQSFSAPEAKNSQLQCPSASKFWHWWCVLWESRIRESNDPMIPHGLVSTIFW